MEAAADAARRLEIRGGTVLTLDATRRVVEASVFIAGARVVAIGDRPDGFDGAEVLHAEGCVVMPGLVQAHVHVCQTLCRGGADDLPLLEWLRERIWPHEAALDERAARAAARLAAAELLLSGTTAVLDMGTVHETDAIADELGRSGLRAVVGKAMMDTGEGVPARMREDTRRSLDESDALAARWEGAFDGRIGWAYAPRFALSCTDALLREVGARVAAGARMHTHASEQVAEIALVRAERGDDNIRYLASVGLIGSRSVLAHCVHATDEEIAVLASRGAHVAHCPSSNLKLGSGIARVPELLSAGVNVALGADGPPCNNNLDAFLEMRLAALLPKPRLGPSAMPAAVVLELATLAGARALGLADVGALAPGMKADLIAVDLGAPHTTPRGAAESAIVYAARGSDVRHTIVDGRVLVRDRHLTSLSGLDRDEVCAVGAAEAARVASRTR